MKLVKTDIPGYYKDTETNSIINKNYEELDLFLSQRERSKKLKNLEIETAVIKEELKDIKHLLLELIKNEK